MIGSQCNTCVNFKVTGTCVFFPNGIPPAIMSGAEPHKEYRNYKTGKTWDQTPEGER